MTSFCGWEVAKRERQLAILYIRAKSEGCENHQCFTDGFTPLHEKMRGINRKVFGVESLFIFSFDSRRRSQLIHFVALVLVCWESRDFFSREEGSFLTM